MSEPSTQSSNVITITESAAAYIEKLLIEDGSADALRVAVMGGGCAGFQYDLGLDNIDDMQDGDQVFEMHDISVIMDEVSLEYLSGVVLDYSDGLNGRGFSFDNPNATSQCGCGTSFNADEPGCTR